MLGVTMSWMTPSRTTDLASARRMRTSLLAHQAIFEAVVRQDPESAKQDMAIHIEEVAAMITTGELQ